MRILATEAVNESVVLQGKRELDYTGYICSLNASVRDADLTQLGLGVLPAPLQA